MSTTEFRNYPWGARHTEGTLLYKNLYSNTFGYTETSKKVAAASTTALMAATNGSNSAQTISITPNPDVPRALVLTVGGVAGNVQAGSVIVSGYNIEGKPMTETFAVTAGGTGTYNGIKAFKVTSSIFIPAQIGTGATFALGYQNVLGLNHKLFKNNTTVKVYTSTVAYGALTLQNAPVVQASSQDLELNTILPATLPNGSLIFTICYAFDNWSLAPVNDNPEYRFTTSTSSTSSSTSTTTVTTSTSTSSTSISSISTSSTSASTSTSSTSTSTTTTP